MHALIKKKNAYIYGIYHTVSVIIHELINKFSP